MCPRSTSRSSRGTRGTAPVTWAAIITLGYWAGLLPVAVCAVLSCSDRVVLLDGKIPPEAAVPADLPSPELRFCSGAQEVILDGQEIRVLSTSATAQKQAPSEMGYVPMRLDLVLQPPSQQRRVLEIGVRGNVYWFYHSECCPALSEMHDGVGWFLFECVTPDCLTKKQLDRATVNSDIPDLVVDGWCGYNWGQFCLNRSIMVRNPTRTATQPISRLVAAVVATEMAALTGGRPSGASKVVAH